jgi:deoxyhypusine monooxygenase
VALGRLEWLDKQKYEKHEQLSQNPYYSVDPAPPAAIKDIEYLREKLLDESESMFERYRYY